MASSGITVRLSDAREAWLEDARFRRLSPVTLREYDRVSAAVVDFVAAAVGEDPLLAELTPRLVRRWLMERPTELRPASVAAYVRPLRAFSRWCAREFGIAEPLASLRAPRVEPTPLVLFRPEQLRALLDGAGLHLAYAITLLVETGLRVSEAVALEIDDLDGAWLRVRRGKGGRPRRVPISIVLRRATHAYLTRARPMLAAPGVDRLLVAGHGGAWTPDALRRALSRLAGRTGVVGVRVSPHTFRHQFAHDIAFSGGSLLALRDVLGHRRLGTVERYAVPDDAAYLDLLPRRTPLQQLRGRQALGRSRRLSGEDDS